MALEPIDYTTHCHAIEDAFQKVVRATDDKIDWLILSPNGQKQYAPEKLGLGFSEFLSSFEDSKVEYGLARVSPPGSDVQKLVLVGWCPDNAPLKTRASFASNFGVVANQVLKSYHVQVTARDEDDLDERELLNKVSNAAGARYSIQNEGPTRTSSAPKPRPSGVPKKPETTTKTSSNGKPATSTKPPFVEPAAPAPAASTKANARNAAADDDWDEPEVEERDLDSNPLKPNKSAWNPVGKVDLQKVIAEENSKSDPRLVNATEAGTPSKINPKDDIERLKKESKVQRDAAMKNYFGTKPPSTMMPKKSDDMVVKGFQSQKSPAQIWAEKHQGQPSTTNGGSKAANAQTDELSESDEEVPPEVSDIKTKFEKMNTKEPHIIKPGQVERPVPSTEAEPTAPAAPSGQKMPIGNPLPGMQPKIDVESEENTDDNDDWDDDDDEDKKEMLKTTMLTEAKPVTAPVPSVVPKTQSVDKKLMPEPETTPALPTRTTESTFVPPPPPRRNVPAPTEATKEPEQPVEESEPESDVEETTTTEQEKLPSAIAEYDNEAEEHNELAFKEGDLIINIVFVDDDWWLGELETTGEKGLFPSNYVQLVD
ncbi:LAME_0F00716g1_1 [Lachancea meyersii CBS 8951]|uniref:LAME_0F00716g1_1 n=1 Tax=Lachancea meyersii CBS 8951 TaxID=1266667 RepID=A0A1G4JPF3_9SACH|nr:LAME_0F00716g1_1 [Lachancea meyersii CBS 8951]